MKNQLPLLVTGAAGFIGARFVEACQKSQQTIISVDKLDNFYSRPEHSGLTFGKKIDRANLFDWLKSESPQLSGIVHLGACSDTTELDVAKLKIWNLDYSKSLWSYATNNRLPLVYASSAATFGAGENGYTDDEEVIPKLHPLNPYGDSKQNFDLWALAEERLGRTPPIWSGFKFFNVYGFGERHKKKMASVILHAFDQISAQGRVKLFKSYRADFKHGGQKRDFIYVADVIRVLNFALTKPIKRGIYNLGSGEARTYLSLAQAVFQALEKPESVEFIEMPEKLAGRYQYFTQATMNRLRLEGYTEPFTPLEAGIANYVEMLKSNSAI